MDRPGRHEDHRVSLVSRVGRDPGRRDRTDENYRTYLRNHILPRWGHTSLSDIAAVDVTIWLKDLRKRNATSTVASGESHDISRSLVIDRAPGGGERAASRSRTCWSCSGGYQPMLPWPRVMVKPALLASAGPALPETVT
jgi:hypothetical protein